MWRGSLEELKIRLSRVRRPGSCLCGQASGLGAAPGREAGRVGRINLNTVRSTTSPSALPLQSKRLVGFAAPFTIRTTSCICSLNRDGDTVLAEPVSALPTPCKGGGEKIGMHATWHSSTDASSEVRLLKTQTHVHTSCFGNSSQGSNFCAKQVKVSHQ